MDVRSWRAGSCQTLARAFEPSQLAVDMFRFGVYQHSRIRNAKAVEAGEAKQVLGHRDRVARQPEAFRVKAMRHELALPGRQQKPWRHIGRGPGDRQHANRFT